MNKYQRLNKKFYSQNTFKLATALLGKYLVRKIGNQILIGKIVETEAYYGPNDKASHASRGKTERTKLMFDHPGLAYIYQIYGMYFCLNIVTEAKDFPAAILIRALEPIEGIKQMQKNRKLKASAFILRPSALTNGPSKLCQALKIDKKLNGENLITSKVLYLTANPKEKIQPTQMQSAKRIGIDYAKSYKHKPWRYYLKSNPFISKK
jgi:DNA-3-methyladenine glycosylase